MAKQPKRLTRREKIELAKQQRVAEQAALKAEVADLKERVATLEAPAVVEVKPQGRPNRDFIGKKENTK